MSVDTPPILMKPYIGYDRTAGTTEAACLVFAPNARRARVLAWRVMQGEFCEEWIDAAANLLRDLPEHLQALDTGVEKVITAPVSCDNCEHWGGHPTDDGCCSFCLGEVSP